MATKLAPTIHSITGADPKAEALADPRGRVSWEELEARTNALGRGIESMGVEVGSHIVLAVGNRREFYEALIGGMRAGMIVTPVKTSWTAEEMAYVLEDAGSKLVVTDLQNGREAASLRGLPTLDLEDDFESWLGRQSSDPLPYDRCGMRMSYTSGTTGRPKGVVRAADTSRPWCEAFAATTAFKDTMSVPTTGPHLNLSALFHGAPLAFSLSLLASGAPVRVLGGWDPDRVLEALADGIHSTCMVPTMFRQLLALPEDTQQAFSAPELRSVMHGGEPCPQPVKQRMIDWWGPVFTEYYGMTEGGLTAATSQEWLERPGTVGRAKNNLEIRILDDDGNRLAPGAEGTIYFATSTGKTFEYRNAAEKTRDAHRDGAFTVGDIGYLDEDGYLFISGRKADLIVSSGVNVYPAEIEDVLFSLPDIRDACVVGAPDETRGETIAAFIALACDDSERDAAAARIEAACEERLAGYKRPRSFLVRDTIPRDGTGKLLRHVLRKELWAGREDVFAAPRRS